MPFDIQALLNKLYLWQLTFILSLSSFSMYFTGDTLFGGEIGEGDAKEQMALVCGFTALAVSILLRYIPPAKRRESERHIRTSISPTQMALCAQITELIPFMEAAKIKTSDYDLNKNELLIKNTEIRLELATLQGLLIRKVDDNGQHLVQYRYVDDKTTFD